ncbi:contractile injection system protein, VgrG/Pvc8 family [Comamonas resistens]|uniref:contractile injection system protein, VgrG/Pvc8 family n=1 Tax=Comamonas resistens TaxID=3046670 RepID=UPI0039BD320C
MAGEQYTHPVPDYRLVVAGQDITARINPRLISLTLTEGREGAADSLELRLSDHDGQLAMPVKGATISLRMGWQGQALLDKGAFKVDEVEHSGAPDELHITARSADVTQDARQRTDKSWHDTTLGAIVGDMAKRMGVAPRIDAGLAAQKVEHADQTNESDVHFLSRLARQHDAVATVKQGKLLFLPINGTTTSTGKTLAAIRITRSSGDQHRYHSSDRDAYTAVRAYWSDPGQARRKGAVAGSGKNEKRLKDTYGSEADALAAARAELQRVERGMATFEIDLALGQPEITPQTPVTVAGFKSEIDGTGWLVKTATHTLGDGGLTTRLEMERAGSRAAGGAPPE